MDDDTRTFKLGLFVVGGFFVLFASIFTIGAGAILKERQLPLYCYFGQSVDGLDVDAPVKYRGINIGKVVAIEPEWDPDRRNTEAIYIRVRCEIEAGKLDPESADFFTDPEAFELQIRNRVAEGLRVQLAWGGITGSKYLELDYLRGPEYVPPKLPFSPAEPYIPTYAAPSLTDIQRGVNDAIQAIMGVDYAGISDRLKAALETLEKRVAEIDSEGISNSATRTLDSADALLRGEDMTASLANLKTITESVLSATARLDELLANKDLERTLADAAATAASLRETSATLETRMPGMLDRVDGVLDAAKQAVDDAAVGQTTESVRGAADQIGAAARDLSAMRDDFSSTMRDLAAAGRSVSRMARRLDEDTSGLLRGGAK